MNKTTFLIKTLIVTVGFIFTASHPVMVVNKTKLELTAQLTTYSYEEVEQAASEKIIIPAGSRKELLHDAPGNNFVKDRYSLRLEYRSPLYFGLTGARAMSAHFIQENFSAGDMFIMRAKRWSPFNIYGIHADNKGKFLGKLK